MTHYGPARTTAAPMRMRTVLCAGLVVVIAAIGTGLGRDVVASSSSTAETAIKAVRGDGRGGLGEADGAVPDGTSVFDDGVPGVTGLDPALLDAVRRAATDAGPGLRFVVDSGWRSTAYQEHLFRQAVSKYGSEAAAARWVAPPADSAHVSGDAIDIGPPGAAAWLSQHGAAYGLCQIYANEPWHYELRAGAAQRGCPAMYADPTQDPRMK